MLFFFAAPTRADTCHSHQKNLVLCCCSVKHRNAPVRDYGVTLVHSPRQAGWLLTGNPGATGHLGVKAWKIFCMLQQSVWSQSGKRHRWFFTLQLSSVLKEPLLPLLCISTISFVICLYLIIFPPRWSLLITWLLIDLLFSSWTATCFCFSQRKACNSSCVILNYG